MVVRAIRPRTRAANSASGTGANSTIWHRERMVGRMGCSTLVTSTQVTEGFGSTPDTNQRWTNLLAERLQGAPGTSRLAVLK